MRALLCVVVAIGLCACGRGPGANARWANRVGPRASAPEQPGPSLPPLGEIPAPDEAKRGDVLAKRGESWRAKFGGQASANFTPLGSQHLRARAKLEQIGDQVEIRVKISEASQGKRRVVLTALSCSPRRTLLQAMPLNRRWHVHRL